MVLILVTWTDSADDEVLKATTQRLGALAKEEANKLGKLDPFIYLNYANGEQPVYENAVTPEDLKRMLHVRDMFDPKMTFDKLWKGGYKLPGKNVRNNEDKDEL